MWILNSLWMRFMMPWKLATIKEDPLIVFIVKTFVIITSQNYLIFKHLKVQYNVFHNTHLLNNNVKYKNLNIYIIILCTFYYILGNALLK